MGRVLLIWGQDGKKFSCHVGSAINGGYPPRSPEGKPEIALGSSGGLRRDASHRQEERDP